MAFSGSGASVAEINNAFRQPGRIVVAPTNLSAAFPYGGTYVGLMAAGVALAPEYVVADLISVEEQGPFPFDQMYVGLAGLTVSMEFHEWDLDTIQLAFPGMTTTSGTGRRKVQFPGALTKGSLLKSTEAVKVLFVPYNTAEHEAVLLRKAVPWLITESPIVFGTRRQTALMVSFECLEDSTATAAEAVAVVDRLAQLTL